MRRVPVLLALLARLGECGLVGVIPPNTIGAVFEATQDDPLEVSLRIVKVPGAGEAQGRALAIRLADQGRMDELLLTDCYLYTSPSPRDRQRSRMPSSV